MAGFRGRTPHCVVSKARYHSAALATAAMDMVILSFAPTGLGMDSFSQSIWNFSMGRTKDIGDCIFALLDAVLCSIFASTVLYPVAPRPWEVACVSRMQNGSLLQTPLLQTGTSLLHCCQSHLGERALNHKNFHQAQGNF